MKKTIILDLDETLSNIRTTLHKALLDVTGKDIHWKHWSTYYLKDVYDTTSEVVLDAMIDHQVIENAIIEPGAKELIEHCKKNDFFVTIMTSRGWHPEGEAITKKWFEDHKISIDELCVIPLKESKSDYLHHYKNIHYFIDDYHPHIIDVNKSQMVKESILINKPWNVEKKWDGIRINNLNEFLCILQREKNCDISFDL